MKTLRNNLWKSSILKVFLFRLTKKNFVTLFSQIGVHLENNYFGVIDNFAFFLCNLHPPTCTPITSSLWQPIKYWSQTHKGTAQSPLFLSLRWFFNHTFISSFTPSLASSSHEKKSITTSHKKIIYNNYLNLPFCPSIIYEIIIRIGILKVNLCLPPAFTFAISPSLKIWN